MQKPPCVRCGLQEGVARCIMKQQIVQQDRTVAVLQRQENILESRDTGDVKTNRGKVLKVEPESRRSGGTVKGIGWVMQLCTTPAARNRIPLRFAEQGSGTSLTSVRVTDICIEDICVLILQICGCCRIVKQTFIFWILIQGWNGTQVLLV